MKLDVDTSGPMFNRQADRVVERATERAEAAVAERGVTLVRSRLGQVLQRPTGYYASRISAVSYGGSHLTTDRGVVYGPWLEGTSRRNQTTRFKGYRTFRIVGQQLQGQAAGIAEPIIDRATRRL